MKRIAILVLVVALMTAMTAATAMAAPGGQGKGKGHGKGQEKVTICHEGQTITVAKPALKGHMKHGDTVGACPTVTDPGTGDTDTTT